MQENKLLPESITFNYANELSNQQLLSNRVVLSKYLTKLVSDTLMVFLDPVDVSSSSKAISVLILINTESNELMDILVYRLPLVKLIAKFWPCIDVRFQRTTAGREKCTFVGYILLLLQRIIPNDSEKLHIYCRKQFM